MTNKAEKYEALICPKCSEDYGAPECIHSCTNCGEPFEENNEVFCGEYILSAGEHFCSKECKDSWEDKEKKKIGKGSEVALMKVLDK